MKLSIITPYYNTFEYTIKLAEVLIPQLTDEVEWIIICDGCPIQELDDEIRRICQEHDNWNTEIILLSQNSGGASVPRNKGLDYAKGEYIAFIDSDDLVSNNYVRTILEKTKENWDYCYMSWKSRQMETIITKEPPSWNCCIWNCIYKRELIGNERFDPKLKMAEDFDFNKRVRKGKRGNIKDILYLYNIDTPNSLCKQAILINEKYKE